MLTERHIQRFSRHILLREVGGLGQEKLLSTCVRLPALNEGGRACALWLARAGIGALALPNDAGLAPQSDASGLLLHEDAGRPLSEAVRERLVLHWPELRFTEQAALGAQPADDAESGIRAALAVLLQLIGPASAVGASASNVESVRNRIRDGERTRNG